MRLRESLEGMNKIKPKVPENSGNPTEDFQSSSDLKWNSLRKVVGRTLNVRDCKFLIY